MDMDITKIIDEYVKISVQWKRLNDSKYQEEQLKKEALIAVNNSDNGYYSTSKKIKLEFTKKADSHSKNISDIKLQLSKVERLLVDVNTRFNEALGLLSSEDIEKLFSMLTSKVQMLKEKLENAKNNCNECRNKADLAFRNRNSEEQQKYSEEALSNYYLALELEDSIPFYEQIIKILDIMIKKSRNGHAGYSF